jgi:hypothetical protein
MAVAPNPNTTGDRDSLLYSFQDSVLAHFERFGYKFLHASCWGVQSDLAHMGATVAEMRWSINTYEENDE